MADSLHLPPLDDASWPEAVADMRKGFAGGLNVYRTMAHHPALLRAWAGLRDHVVVQTTLGRELSEVAILRTGVRLGSSYEWNQHVARARKCGLTDARIGTIRGDPSAMAPTDGLIAKAVDELFDMARLTSATAAEMAGAVGKEGVLDLMATVGFYSTLGFILNTFATPLDDDIAAELAEKPFDPG
ncbi:carboxymuconolactone decarboxylase family protein [Defluviimonas sp. SAOS-178_SWC]|uniref:carboxymuconolactone decarboxylase family protein n=1 Tax=Defluviimonas sp. SAOS-178_SWC TaxID=3121287 RepID=UPI00322199C2